MMSRLPSLVLRSERPLPSEAPLIDLELEGTGKETDVPLVYKVLVRSIYTSISLTLLGLVILVVI